ncbi:hypothetical protein ACA910_004603 [Epithemia clementina (nom. ined.)]
MKVLFHRRSLLLAAVSLGYLSTSTKVTAAITATPNDAAGFDLVDGMQYLRRHALEVQVLDEDNYDDATHHDDFHALAATCPADAYDLPPFLGGCSAVQMKCTANNRSVVRAVRALKMLGGGPPVVAGRPLAPEYASEERLDLVTAGCTNLARRIANARKFGVRIVVTINQLKTDTPAELQAVQEEAVKAGAHAAVIANHWALGGQGAADLARAVAEGCETAVREGDQFRFLCDGTLSIAEKIETISHEIYGALGVEYSEVAQRQMQQYQEAGYGKFPICIAKMQYSFSCNPALKGVPTDCNRCKICLLYHHSF